MAHLNKLFGREGFTLGPMTPTGCISVDGKLYDAKSDRYLKKGSPIIVTGSSFSLLLVEPSTSQLRQLPAA